MNGLEKPFRKKSDLKNRKNSKNRSEIAACEQKNGNFFTDHFDSSMKQKIKKWADRTEDTALKMLHFLERNKPSQNNNLCENRGKLTKN